MSDQAFDVRPADAEYFERALRSFLPPNIFDAHAHLYRLDQQGNDVIPFMAKGPAVVGLELFRSLTRRWMGQLAPTDGLFFALPRKSMDIAASNRFIRDEVGHLS